ncbi:MAG: fibro-slime domain-containing protein, partial [Planctomycetota bacterium]
MLTTTTVLAAFAITGGAQGTDDPTAGIDTLRITGVVRDFQVTHPDFEAYIGALDGMVLNELGSDGKPQLDVDAAASRGWGSNAKVTSQESFDQWFRDVPGVNVSMPLTIELERQERDSGPVYVFAKEKPEYFFPIDSAGYGLSMEGLRWASAGTHNFHFTYELETEFTFTDPKERENDLIYSFTGDDDVWVFINGQLVIDLGGVHGQLKESINLDDAAEDLGLEPGEQYQLKLF